MAASTSEMKSAYLITGSDEAKIDAARARLRARAEGVSGAVALHTFDPADGRGAPDAEALLAAIPALSLGTERRFLLADHVERWSDADRKAVSAALASLPDDLTIVLIARGKAPAGLGKAIAAAGGETLSFEAPRQRDLPTHLVNEARQAGFRLEPAAARLLVERMGAGPVRLANEIDRLALWAGEGGEVTASDLEEMIGDTSEAATWSLSDALLERDCGRAVALAERLLAQGENVTGLTYALASRLRSAQRAVVELDRGRPPKEVEASLSMHPYAAKQLVARVRGTSLEQLREATAALADLEVWCRGGTDYGDELAFTIAIRRAAGGEAEAPVTEPERLATGG
jgi:DNA polymerase-3 subunit delta